MEELKYLGGYSEDTKSKVRLLLAQNRLGEVLSLRYTGAHDIKTDKALYGYVLDIKNRFLRNTEPLSKVLFDSRIKIDQQALGLHTAVSRVQGSRLKSKRELRVAPLFKDIPPAFLKMIVVHELAHLKEKDHDKAFYQLCLSMEPDYHQIEFDLRLYLTYLDLFKTPLWQA
jgi:predicted metal-dependent hydrolase